jgi:hypothetical protein
MILSQSIYSLNFLSSNTPPLTSQVPKRCGRGDDEIRDGCHRFEVKFLTTHSILKFVLHDDLEFTIRLGRGSFVKMSSWAVL